MKSLLGGVMRSGDRLVGSLSRQCVEQFDETRLVRITHGGFAIWLNPFGMLNPQVVVNLLPQLSVCLDLVRHGYVKDLRMPRSSSNASPEYPARSCPAEHMPTILNDGVSMLGVCAALGQLDCFMALPLQQHRQQSTLRKCRRCGPNVVFGAFHKLPPRNV